MTRALLSLTTLVSLGLWIGSAAGCGPKQDDKHARGQEHGGEQPFKPLQPGKPHTLLAARANNNAQEVTEEEAWTLPAPIDDLVYARQFTLTTGYRWSWRADEPATEVGVIVVLRVDPELVVPRNSPSPILYAGDRMIQALNFGHKSGNVIGIIPGEVNLLQTPIWFGSPRVPALVSAQSIRAQRALAERAGIRPFPAKTLKRVTKAPVEAPDLDSLLRGELADLVLEYAPDESNLARKWRLPEAKAKPDPSRPGVGKP